MNIATATRLFNKIKDRKIRLLHWNSGTYFIPASLIGGSSWKLDGILHYREELIWHNYMYLLDYDWRFHYDFEEELENL